MKLMKRIIVALLVLSLLNFFFPKALFVEKHYAYAKAGKTKHKPEIITAPEEVMPEDWEYRKWPGIVWKVCKFVIFAAIVYGAYWYYMEQQQKEGDIIVEW